MVKWLNKEQIDGSDINLVIENSLYGQILEVDLKYSNELHILHNDYPLAPDNLKITCNMLLVYCTYLEM